jgi:hypothetical protein
MRNKLGGVIDPCGVVYVRGYLYARSQDEMDGDAWPGPGS